MRNPIPPVPTTDELLAGLLDMGATDLLVTAGGPPFVRIDGSIHRTDWAIFAPDDTERLVASLLTEVQWAEFAKTHDFDFSFNWRGRARLRANAFRQRGAAGLAVRVIPFHIPPLREIGLPPVVKGMLSEQQGLILVTGPTGSGKSTTLASMIDWINENRPLHILTIEDPIEYVHEHKMSAVNQREIGHDSESFARALRSALREDPDVLLVGEMRDLDSIQATLTIAETGHLVFGTLHTNDTAQAIDRIIDVFPGDRQQQIRIQLASVLRAVIHQRLLPRVEGGRVAVFEVLVATPAVRNLIKEGKTRQIPNALSTGQRDGMQTFQKALADLTARGIVAASQDSLFGAVPMFQA